MQSAFITGAQGFIGRTLAARLRAQGVEVRGVDFEADPARGVVAGDVTESGKWQERTAGCDLVVHTAAIVSNAYDLDTSWKVNVLGTRRALDAAARGGAERFVHLSSVRAFSDLGFPPGVGEEHPVRPDGNPYVDTKIASEQVVLQAHAAGEVAVTIIRPADVYGPGSRPWTVLPIEAIRAGQFMLPAHGRGVFSPVYVENLLDGLLLAAGAPAAAGEIFTLGDGVAVSCREFFGHYFRMLGRRGPLCVPTGVAVAAAAAVSAGARVRGVATEVNPATMRYLARRGSYSIAKARRVLGYQPGIALEEGMARTETWLREARLL